MIYLIVDEVTLNKIIKALKKFDSKWNSEKKKCENLRNLMMLIFFLFYEGVSTLFYLKIS